MAGEKPTHGRIPIELNERLVNVELQLEKLISLLNKNNYISNGNKDEIKATKKARKLELDWGLF